MLVGPEATPLWTATAVETCSQLIAAKGQVLCAANNHVWSLDDAGHPKWSPVDLLNGSSPGTDVAVVADGRVYAFGLLAHYSGARVAAVGLDDGHVYWDATPKGEFATYRVAGVVDGVVYLAGSTLWAVDASSQKTLGDYPWPNQEIALVPPTGSRWLFRSPRTGSDTVVRLQAFDIARGGRPVPGWQRELPGDVDSGYACVAAGHFVCTGNQLFALDPATGTQVWASKETGHFQQPTASPDGSLVFVADLNTFYAFDAATGALRWQTEPAKDSTPGSTGSGMAYREASRPQCADGNVYVLDGRSVLWALDPASGAVRWKYSGARQADPFKNEVVWSAGGGRVYVADPVALTVVGLNAAGR
ncbi:PQQ-binding-like beta-propeller repeat protein [Kitasatospora sp. NPDC058965]|uniref:outer membrane protein assembly factor BamB family protein n=1 Tax=Kitasatospora sp. NPDC058965 TaxID=3346682 RepID=UPI0036B5C4DB